MKTTIKITTDKLPYLESLGRRLSKDEVVEADKDIADFFVKNGLAVENESSGNESSTKKKRARNSKGHWKSDDLSTPTINEAYE